MIDLECKSRVHLQKVMIELTTRRILISCHNHESVRWRRKCGRLTHPLQRVPLDRWWGGKRRTASWLISWKKMQTKLYKSERDAEMREEELKLKLQNLRLSLNSRLKTRSFRNASHAASTPSLFALVFIREDDGTGRSGMIVSLMSSRQQVPNGRPLLKSVKCDPRDSQALNCHK